jgi:uncharacterized protein
MIHDEGSSNTSQNREFSDVLEVNLSRRKALVGGLATAVSAFLAAPGVALAARGGLPGANPGRGPVPLIGFTPVPTALATGPVPQIAPEYTYDTLIPWGDKLYPGQSATPYDGDPATRPTAAEQAELVGIGHDGMTFFPQSGNSNTAGMLAINHEFGTNPHVFGKPSPASLEDVRLSQHSHGVSVVALSKTAGKWSTVYSPNARRIHVNTPVDFSGPVAGHPILQTAAGNPTLGTLNNCANGETPWGTYLTCEENFNGYFGVKTGGTWVRTPEQARYGFSSGGFGYGWQNFDPRFDLANPAYKNEENRFGWVVEIDPNDGTQVPVKRTALGRFKHEGAELVVGRGGRAVVYMGDDERFDYIYKFVSDGNWQAMRARGVNPLDEGRLYVARFNDDGTGNWLELTIDNPVLAARFNNQAEVLTYARIAGDLLGATKMDRPEWASVASDGYVYCTLTNNTARTAANVNAANPLAPNPDGHIIRWLDSDQHVGLDFTWDIYILAQDTHGATDERTFSSPDGLWADPDGRLFIQTDGTQKKGMNDQMLVADLDGIEIRRMLSGVTSCEVTGVAYTPDRRTLFVNLQHPGDGNPALTNFPAPQGSGKIPRDVTLVITRKNGGIVGS